MQCNSCGRFFRYGEAGSSWAHVYDMIGHGLDRELHRCRKCTEAKGAVQSNARPHDGDMRPYQGTNT